MSVLAQARALGAAGRAGEARALVEGAAERGDEEALLALAHWRLHGLYGPRDLADAHRLLARAGEPEAIRLRANLLAGGIGCPPDPDAARALLATIGANDPLAAAQLDLLPRMSQGPLPAPEPLRTDPPVRLHRALLSAAECEYLCRLAAPLLAPSVIIDSAGRRQPHPTRTSAGMSFGPIEEDLVVRALNRRLARATGTEPTQGEPLHILRYAPGQEYKPHLDALPAVANQRHWTALVYLNSGYAGGETAFPELDLAVRGEPGDALVFRNVDAAGRPDPRTRHAGRPVTADAKWLATRWIRQSAYDPWTGR